MRPLDKADAVERLLPFVTTEQKSQQEGFRVVVATQAIEVGADFDFDHLITEVAPFDCLLQRIGRLDRQGVQYETKGDASSVVILGIKAELKSTFNDPFYKSASKCTWQFLSDELEKRDDFTINAASAAEEWKADEECLSPNLRAPLLLPTHIDAWVQTNPDPGTQPDVNWFLHGVDIKSRIIPEVSVVWRWDHSQEALNLVPIRQVERLDLPLHAVQKWLSRVSDEEADLHLDVDDISHRSMNELKIESTTSVVSVYRSKEILNLDVDEVRAGDTVIVNPDFGGLEEGIWNPNAKEKVQDLGDHAQLSYGESVTLRLDPRLRGSSQGMPNPKDEVDADQPLRERLEIWLRSQVEEATLSPQETLILEKLLKNGFVKNSILLGDVEGEIEYYVLKERRRDTQIEISKPDESVMEDDEDSGSITDTGVTLSRHLEGVGSRASETARRLGFSAEIVSDIELSGRLHDIGKVDERFQKMLVGGDEIEYARLDLESKPLAKSIPGWRRTNIYPKGMRHETASVALISSNDRVLSGANDPDLVTHLVGAHHGWCRPFPLIVRDDKPLPLRFAMDGVAMWASSDQVNSDLAIECAERFWTLVSRYGHHGLAWLEAVLRLSDHIESAQGG